MNQLVSVDCYQSVVSYLLDRSVNQLALTVTNQWLAVSRSDQ
jgi:hypothetical protein